MTIARSTVSSRITRWATAAIASALVLAACGSDGGSAEASADIGTEAFGLTEEEYTAAIDGVEGDIETCMADAGFEYIAADIGTIEDALASLRAEPGLSREEYKATYGFAVSTRFDNPVKDAALGENLATIESLPEADRVAYERTLFGDDTSATFAFTLDEEDFSTTSGCTRTAVENHFTEEQLTGAYVNPKDVLVEDDPRMVEARDAWSGCMNEAGFDYGDQDDIIGELEERFAALVGDADPAALAGAEADQLAALQAEEVELAVLDLECSVEHIDDVEEIVEEELFGNAL